MPRGSLFSDISEGIFGRLNELNLEQTKRDNDKRGQVLNLLTGLMDQVEPESQGVLLGHIGDVMKLKGKERGLWDRLTGRNMDATEQALGGKLQEVLGLAVGPGTARQKRGAAVADVATSTFRSPQTLNQAAGLGRSIVMRDPQRERLDQIKTQYGMQFAQRQALQDDAQAAIAERQKDLANQKDMLKRRSQIFEAEVRAGRELDALAKNIAASKGRPNSVIDADTIEAGKMLMQTYAYDDDLKQALFKLQGARTTEAMANAQAVQSGEGISAPVARKESADRQLQGEIQKQYGDYQRALTEVDSKRKMYLSKVSALKQLAQQRGVQFDESSGVFQGSETGVFRANFEADRSGLLKDVKQLRLDITDAEGRLKGPYDSLTKAYGQYVTVDPKTGVISLKPPFGAPRTQSGVPSPSPAKPLPPVPPVKAPSKYPRGTPPPIQMPLGAMNPGAQLPRTDLSGARIPSTKEPIPMPGGQAAPSGGGYTRGRFSSRKLQQGESIKLSDGKWYAVEGIENPDSPDPIYKFRLLPQQ